MSERRHWFSQLAPGILLAATGVGAGDILTTSLAGSEVGLVLMWTVVAGAVLKFTLSEGIARWQLATGTTLLEGWALRLGPWIRWLFFAYLLLYTLSVGGALASACGVAGTGFLAVGDPHTSRVFWGILHSAVGLLIAWRGSFRLFEIVMAALAGIMFFAVVLTAVAIGPDYRGVAAGFIPSVPAGGSSWVLAVLGGVGGTVTLLSYGYWIREEGRAGLKDVRVCRWDLAAGNGMTAVFGLGALVIGSRLELQGQGAVLASQLADQLAGVVGGWGRWLFLAGFWGAVFSSLLGVWQSIPYLFADFLELSRMKRAGAARSANLRATRPYRAYLLFIATVPLIALFRPVREIQLAYGVIACLFMPLLAFTLLILNNRKAWVGREFATPPAANLVLVVALALFSYLGVQELADLIRSR
jgi:Mn2+/Fe2+ NRAMP family transporter